MKKRVLSRRLSRRSALPLSLALLIGAPLLLSVKACRAGDESLAPPAVAAPSTVPTAPATPSPLVGKAAPTFTLLDAEGKTRALADYHGQPVVLYVFCGCRPCHKCARAWGQIQRSGILAQAAGKPSAIAGGQAPWTLVLFHGDAEAIRTFVEETQLDLKNSVLLPDADEKISASYKAEQCPRVFVLDAQGVVRYTNDEEGEDSYKIPAPLIVSRAVDALRRVASGANPDKPKATPAPAKNQKSDKAGKQPKEHK